MSIQNTNQNLMKIPQTAAQYYYFEAFQHGGVDLNSDLDFSKVKNFLLFIFVMLNVCAKLLQACSL